MLNRPAFFVTWQPPHFPTNSGATWRTKLIWPPLAAGKGIPRPTGALGAGLPSGVLATTGLTGAGLAGAVLAGAVMSPMASDSGIAATLAPSSSMLSCRLASRFLSGSIWRCEFRHVRQFDEGHLGLGEGFGGRATCCCSYTEILPWKAWTPRHAAFRSA